MSEVTQILSAIEQGIPRPPTALAARLESGQAGGPKTVQEKPGQTFQATALVHEAYVRLVGASRAREWVRGHFFAAAAEAMRRILVDRAGEKGHENRGGTLERIDVDAVELAGTVTPDQLLWSTRRWKNWRVNDAVAAWLV